MHRIVATLVVPQPGYLAWVGYFDLLQKTSCTMTTCSGVSISALPVQNVAGWT